MWYVWYVWCVWCECEVKRHTCVAVAVAVLVLHPSACIPAKLELRLLPLVCVAGTRWWYCPVVLFSRWAIT